MEAKAAEAAAHPTTTQPAERSTTLVDEPVMRSRHRLPHLHKFSGKREDWQQWNMSATMKLKTDYTAIGGPGDQFTYLYMAMETEPQSRMTSWVQRAMKSGNDTPEAFLEQAKITFSDPNEQQNAHTRLANMRQGKEAFHTFLPKFEAELARAGGADWAEAVQVNYLRATLNTDLAMAIITGRLPRNDYHAFKDGVLAIDADLQALQANKPTKPGHSNPATSKGNAQEDKMDWEPTKANSRRRVTQEEIEQRRDSGACIKCGKKGHFGRECRTGWRADVAKATTKANQAKTEEDKQEDKQEGGKDPKE